MNFSVEEIRICRLWAEEHAGDDNVAEVMEWKLLEVGRVGHKKSADWHDRQLQAAHGSMLELEGNWKVSGPTDLNKAANITSNTSDDTPDDTLPDEEF